HRYCRVVDAGWRTALALWQVEHLSLRGGEHVQCSPTGSDPLAAGLHQALDGLVVMPGLMVKQRQSLGLCRQCDIHPILDRAVPPPEPLLVFCQVVLRVVDDEVCSSQERDMPLLLTMCQPGRYPSRSPVSNLAPIRRMGLVVSGIDHSHTARFQ